MAWYIGQSLPMMAIAFLVGLLVGYLLWGRRYRRLEQAEAVRAVDPATVLPHRGSAAAAAAAPAAAVADEHDETHEHEAADESDEQDGTEEHDEADEAVVEAADDDRPAEAAAEGADDSTDEAADEAADHEDHDDHADAAGDASDEAAAEAAVAVEAGPTVEDDDHDDAEPPTAEQIAAQAEPESLFAAAGQPEPAAPASVSTSDRLEQIEGIGPKIALALRTAGIRTFEDLAGADEATLRDALADANLRFAPSLTTWAQQARLLADGDHEGHATLTQQLVAGRAPKAQ